MDSHAQLLHSSDSIRDKQSSAVRDLSHKMTGSTIGGIDATSCDGSLATCLTTSGHHFDLARSNDLYKTYHPVSHKSSMVISSSAPERLIGGSTDKTLPLRTHALPGSGSTPSYGFVSGSASSYEPSAALTSGDQSSSESEEQQRSHHTPPQPPAQSAHKGTLLGSLFGRFSRARQPEPPSPPQPVAEVQAPAPAAPQPDGESFSAAASGSEDEFQGAFTIRRSITEPVEADLYRRCALEMEPTPVMENSDGASTSQAPASRDGRSSRDSRMASWDGGRQSRDIMRRSSVRMRGDIQSAPAPDRDRRRRCGFDMMDVEDNDFVNSDLAARSSAFNLGLHQVPSSSRPRR